MRQQGCAPRARLPVVPSEALALCDLLGKKRRWQSSSCVQCDYGPKFIWQQVLGDLGLQLLMPLLPAALPVLVGGSCQRAHRSQCLPLSGSPSRWMPILCPAGLLATTQIF